MLKKLCQVRPEHYGEREREGMGNLEKVSEMHRKIPKGQKGTPKSKVLGETIGKAGR
jgi:hypothetical protein